MNAFAVVVVACFAWSANLQASASRPADTEVPCLEHVFVSLVNADASRREVPLSSLKRSDDPCSEMILATFNEVAQDLTPAQLDLFCRSITRPWPRFSKESEGKPARRNDYFFHCSSPRLLNAELQWFRASLRIQKLRFLTRPPLSAEDGAKVKAQVLDVAQTIRKAFSGEKAAVAESAIRRLLVAAEWSTEPFSYSPILRPLSAQELVEVKQAVEQLAANAPKDESSTNKPHTPLEFEIVGAMANRCAPRVTAHSREADYERDYNKAIDAFGKAMGEEREEKLKAAASRPAQQGIPEEGSIR